MPSTNNQLIPIQTLEANTVAIINQFRIAEFLGHHLAYLWAIDTRYDRGLPEPINLDASQALSGEFNLQKILLKDANGEIFRGINGFILLPNIYQLPQYKMYIVWTGTHNWQSLCCNLERQPAEKTYRLFEAEIVTTIIQALQQVQNKIRDLNLDLPIDIEILGHSLGGALSQLTYHSLQFYFLLNCSKIHTRTFHEARFFEKQFLDERGRFVALPPNFKPLSELGLNYQDFKMPRSLSLLVWNSTGVLNVVANSSHTLSSKLVRHSLIEAAYYGVVTGDPIHHTGQANILNDANLHCARIYLLNITEHLAFNYLNVVKNPRLRNLINVLVNKLQSDIGSYISRTRVVQQSNLLAIAKPLVIVLPQLFKAYRRHTSSYFSSCPIEFRLSDDIKLYQSSNSRDLSCIENILKDKSEVADLFNLVTSNASTALAALPKPSISPLNYWRAKTSPPRTTNNTVASLARL